MPITPEQASDVSAEALQQSDVPPQQERGADLADRRAEDAQQVQDAVAIAGAKKDLRSPAHVAKEANHDRAAEKKVFVPLRVVIEATAPKGTVRERISNFVHGGTTVTRGSDATPVTFPSVQAMHTSDRYGRLSGIVDPLAPREACLFAMKLINQLQNDKGVLDDAAFEEVVKKLTAHCEAAAGKK
jgi:hypothetical protein